MRDVTERRKLSRQISFQATHDALTGMFNRYEFERRLQQLLENGAGEHALLYLDLDQIKVVNDSCGQAPAMSCCVNLATPCVAVRDRATRWQGWTAMSRA
jgi:diguanylate cyclase (GGDEF)-like protein